MDVKKYFWNILVGIDQLGNAITGGDPDETISSRLGKVVVKKAETSNIAWIVCYLLSLVDSDHCQEAIEPDEGKDEVVHL